MAGERDVLAEALETIIATWPPAVSEREHRRDFRDRQRIAVELLERLAARGWRLVPSAEPEPPPICPTCDGAGWVAGISADPLPSGEPGEPYQVQETCPDCGGAGVLAAPSPEPLPREALDVAGLRIAVMRSLEQDDRDPHGDYREMAASIAREYAALSPKDAVK